MRKLRLFSVGIFLIACFCVTCTSLQKAERSKKISRPFEYSGYTYPTFKSYRKTSEYVKMSDGVKLAVDIYLPSDGPEKDGYPTIFQYTPYGRAYILPDLKWWQKPFLKAATGSWGPVLDRANSRDTVYGSSKEMVDLFLSYGYAYVCADMRGTGASYGWKADYMPKLADDGMELVDWIDRQPWCDGNIGMFGGSYLGYSQLITAGKKPKGLKCIFPEVVPLDGYTGEIRPGGIFLWIYSAQDYQHLLEQNQSRPDEGLYPTAPVVDEDGDGDLADELPIDKNGNGTFLDDYTYPEDPDDPPQYKDGQPRKHIYYLATYAHKQNIPYNSLGPQVTFIDTKIGVGVGTEASSVTAYDSGPGSGLPSIIESGIPVYNHGGWMDVFVRGTTELYCTLTDTNPSKMLIDVGYHLGTSPFWEYCGEDEKEARGKYGTEMLRYFDRYLKGIENGIDTEPPIYIYVMNGGGWRFEKEWPLARQVLTEYYFEEGGELCPARATEGSDSYTAVYEHDARWGSFKTNRWMMETPDELPIRTEKDKQCLTYTSSPMSSDTEVTGHPIVDFWVSSTADYGDFFVYLEDVNEHGEALLVTEGLLNAGFAQLQNNNSIVLGGKTSIEVLPDLPWHGYEKAQYVDRILADGKIVRLYFDLLPTSWVFRRGHSIRISIACADWPTFELHPKLAPTNKPDDPANIIPTITVYRDAEHPSRIILPVIP